LAEKSASFSRKIYAITKTKVFACETLKASWIKGTVVAVAA
jgi:hypothetical protein